MLTQQEALALAQRIQARGFEVNAQLSPICSQDWEIRCLSDEGTWLYAFSESDMLALLMLRQVSRTHYTRNNHER